MAVKGLNLQFFCPPTYVDLHVLVTTGVDFEQAQIHTQVDASFSAFGRPTQIDTRWSEVIVHFSKSIHKFWFCNNLCRLSSLFGQD